LCECEACGEAVKWEEILLHCSFFDGKRTVIKEDRDVEGVNRYEFFFELLNDMVTFVGVLEPDGTVVFVNNTPLKLTGLRLEDVKGKKFYDTYWWTYSDKTRDTIKRDIERCAAGESFVHEIQARIAKGMLIWVEFSMHPVYDESGNLKYLMAEGRDVTEKRQALVDAQQKAAYLDNMPTYMAVTDPQGFLQFTSAVTIEKFGFKLEDVVGKRFEDMPWFKHSDELQERMREVVRRAARGESFEFEVDVMMGAELVPIKYTCDPLRDEGGNIYALLHTGTRIDELKAALEKEKKLSEAILRLSTPIIQIWDNTLLLPLIGTLDAERAQQIVENLLEEIVRTESDVVIIDISGVPTVDVEAIHQLLKTESAAKMLGSRVLFTGISPEIAQALTQLGVDLSTLETRQNLRAGLQEAISIVKNNPVSLTPNNL
jgi:PAS domain S-box-containing protein